MQSAIPLCCVAQRTPNSDRLAFASPRHGGFFVRAQPTKHQLRLVNGASSWFGWLMVLRLRCVSLVLLIGWMAGEVQLVSRLWVCWWFYV
jgi:hypothetical protein